MSRVRIGAVSEFPEGEARRVDVAGQQVAVVRIDDDIYAIGDQCSHADVSLADGEVDVAERTLECYQHGSTFRLSDGEPTCLPATRPVPTYAVVVDGDDVYVEAT